MKWASTQKLKLMGVSHAEWQAHRVYVEHNKLNFQIDAKLTWASRDSSQHLRTKRFNAVVNHERWYHVTSPIVVSILPANREHNAPHPRHDRSFSSFIAKGCFVPYWMWVEPPRDHQTITCRPPWDLAIESQTMTHESGESVNIAAHKGKERWLLCNRWGRKDIQFERFSATSR